MRELGDDRRVDRGVVHLGRGEEDVDLRLDFARELLEHEVLILHLGAEARGLEQALAVPLQGIDLGLSRRKDHDRGAQPLIEERDIVRCNHILDVPDQAVVLGVEDEVDGGQADVLVAAAVAGDEVGVEQLVVVGRCLRSSPNQRHPLPASASAV